ncbi:MAG: hypothetical protein LBI78_05285 [Campylobacteraceae bacterium]|jgi:hypothetical protein|nr:hypothetical protein [Campylobacteraceae bacterium]
MFIFLDTISVSNLFQKIAPLLIGLFLIGCGGRSCNNMINADTPFISVQPQSMTYTENDNAIPLNVTASVTDCGILSYQWFELDANSTEEGKQVATMPTYTPHTNETGVKYYYVKVTNTNTNATGDKIISVTSDIAIITVKSDTHTVRFYDDNLDFIHMETVAKGIIDPALIFFGVWYKARENTQTTSHNLTSNINFYTIPDVIEITNQDELNAIRYKLDGNYILMNNITLSNDGAGFDEDGWEPIGNYSSRIPFKGIFNGNDYAIKDLWIYRLTTSGVGFFGFANTSQIKNVGITVRDGNEIQGNNTIGGIVGYVDNSNIKNCYSIGGINDYSSFYVGYLGGIAGYANNSNISNSYSGASINGRGTLGDKFNVVNYVGGIVGYASFSQISNSYSDWFVSGGDHVGGIVGYASFSQISNSYSVSMIVGHYTLGGIAGSISNSNITSSYSSINSDYFGGSGPTGGIAGNAQSSIIMNNAAFNRDLEGMGSGRIAGTESSFQAINNFASNSTLINGMSTKEYNGDFHGIGKSEEEFKIKSTYETGLSWSFGDNDTNPWKMDANKNNGYPYFYWDKR